MQFIAMCLFVSLTACRFLTAGGTQSDEDEATARASDLPVNLTGTVKQQAQPASELPSYASGGQTAIAGGVYMAAGNIEPPQDSGSRVLVVIANKDFDFREYAAIRKTLERNGHSVVVAAERKLISTPEAGSAPVASGMVMPDLAWSNVDSNAYDALILVGGRGAYRYLQGFPGVFTDPKAKVQVDAAARLNLLISSMIAQDKHIAALGTAIAILAWARHDDSSPIASRQVAGADVGLPACTLDGRSYTDGQVSLRYQLERNGAIVADPGLIGNPSTSADDVVADGRFLTGAGAEAATEFAQILGTLLDDWRDNHSALVQ